MAIVDNSSEAILHKTCHLNGVGHNWYNLLDGYYWCCNCGALGTQKRDGSMEWTRPTMGRPTIGSFLGDLSSRRSKSK
jgi:hypothetical protein